MEVKIDTKEKFTVITPITLDVSANIAADLVERCRTILANRVKNLILNLTSVTNLDEAGMEGITQLQQEFYENNASSNMYFIFFNCVSKIFISKYGHYKYKKDS